MTKTTRPGALPWGRTTGLLAACLATLIGVGSGLDPDVVLLRAASAGMVVGLLGTAVTTAWQWWIQQETDRAAAGRQVDRSRWSGDVAATRRQDVAQRREAE